MIIALYKRWKKFFFKDFLRRKRNKQLSSCLSMIQDDVKRERERERVNWANLLERKWKKTRNHHETKRYDGDGNSLTNYNNNSYMQRWKKRFLETSSNTSSIKNYQRRSKKKNFWFKNMNVMENLDYRVSSLSRKNEKIWDEMVKFDE